MYFSFNVEVDFVVNDIDIFPPKISRPAEDASEVLVIMFLKKMIILTLFVSHKIENDNLFSFYFWTFP